MNIHAIKIVILECSYWRASTKHKGETQRVNAANNTDAARVSVRLCNHPALKKLGSLHAAAYVKHKALTRPSITDKMRILVPTKAIAHEQLILDTTRDHDALVTEFLDAYENERDGAQSRLNGLYEANKWPSLYAMRQKFGVRIQRLDAPTDPSWKEWLKESSKSATSELCDDIEKCVEHIADVCANGGKLYASIFENLRTLLHDVPQYDCGLDARLVALAGQAEILVHADSVAIAETLRDDPAERTSTAGRARAILDAFGGGSLAE